MRVLIVAEFYPRRSDPTLGTWAHEQARAARDAGADVRVLALHRPIAPAAQLSDRQAWRKLLTQPRSELRDGIPVRYVRFISPQRGRSYPDWGRYAAPTLAYAIAQERRRHPFDLIHAHYAVPAGDAVLNIGSLVGDVPLVVSEHGGDLFHTALTARGERRVRAVFAAARLVLANSDGIAARIEDLGARNIRVVELGTELPAPRDRPLPAPSEPTLVTLAHLVPRKRHEDVIHALWILRASHPDLRYRIIGDGPERGRLAALAARLEIADRVDFLGQLEHKTAVRRAREGTLFVMPSIDEAFGVAYIEAMAAGLPTIGARGEDGPEHLAARTIGMRLVPPGEPELLAQEIAELLEPRWHSVVSAAARQIVREHYSRQACGRATVAAYRQALHGDD